MASHLLLNTYQFFAYHTYPLYLEGLWLTNYSSNLITTAPIFVTDSISANVNLPPTIRFFDNDIDNIRKFFPLFCQAIIYSHWYGLFLPSPNETFLLSNLSLSQVLY